MNKLEHNIKEYPLYQGFQLVLAQGQFFSVLLIGKPTLFYMFNGDTRLWLSFCSLFDYFFISHPDIKPH